MMRPVFPFPWDYKTLVTSQFPLPPYPVETNHLQPVPAAPLAFFFMFALRRLNLLSFHALLGLSSLLFMVLAALKFSVASFPHSLFSYDVLLFFPGLSANPPHEAIL